MAREVTPDPVGRSAVRGNGRFGFLAFRSIAAIGTGCLVFSCTNDNGPSNTPAHIAAAAGANQSATVGVAVPIRPSVVVTDVQNQPIQGVTVSFATGLGGGSVSGATRPTDAQGVATVGDWVLGTAAGTNTLTAKVSGRPALTFTATGTAGKPRTITPVTPLSQAGAPNTAVSTPPGVKVTDAFGNGVSGMVIAFAVTVGGGSIAGVPNVVTNSNGGARVGSWLLGPSPGSNGLTATAPLSLQGNPVTFTANTVSSAYTIDVRFVSALTPTQQQAFLAARDRLQALITGDVPNVPVNLQAGTCLPAQPAINENVDDLIIFAEVLSIDGPGKVLGRAGPCLIRSTGNLPVVGIMQFDVADLDALEVSGQLPAVILHEMMHVLGFGSIWPSGGLLSGAGGPDPTFTGANAIVSFNAIGGSLYPGNPVPVENTGGAGTRDSHWRETVFKSELMTGFLNSGANPLSVVTANQFADLGYAVNIGVTDPFTITPPFTAPGRTAISLRMFDDGWQGPLFTIDHAGRVLRVSRR